MGRGAELAESRRLGTFRRLSQVRGVAVATGEGTRAAVDRGPRPWDGMKRTLHEGRGPVCQPLEPQPDPGTDTGAASCEQTVSRVPPGHPRHPQSPEAGWAVMSAPWDVRAPLTPPLCVQAAPQTSSTGVLGAR